MSKILEQYNLDPIYIKFITFVLVTIVIFIIFSLLTYTFNTKLKDSSTRYKFRKVFSFIAFVIFIFAGLNIFQVKMTNLSVFFGLTGAGIAFTLQDLIVSFVAWFAISLGRVYKTGDRISIAGIHGDVIDIDFLRTTLMECGSWVKGDLYNGRLVRIPNSSVFKDAVFNYNLDYPFLWDELTIPIKHGSDIEKARAVFLDIAQEVTGDYAQGAKVAWEKVVRKYMIENASVDPIVTITANENFVEYTVRYITHYTKKRTTKDQIYSLILKAIEETDGICIASTTLDINHLPLIQVSNQPN